MSMEFKKFDVNTVPLIGSNLVEASAGTGKTYSIAVLTLRLVLEKKIPLKEILMVTFTKAAVAELEIRIRKFVREAYKYSLEDAVRANNDVEKLVNEIGKPASAEILYKAVQQLDETSILTIHSFCQNILTEFAFETGQAYDLNLLEDLSAEREDEVKDFWRKGISNIEKENFEYLLNGLPKWKVYNNWYKYLSVDAFSNALKNSLENKFFLKRELAIDEHINIKQQEREVEQEIIAFINHKKVDYVEKITAYEAKRYTVNTRAKLIQGMENPIKFVEDILKTTSQHPKQIFKDEIPRFKKLMEKKGSVKLAAFETHIERLISSKRQEITNIIKSKNQVSFDDLINNLNHAIVNTSNQRLIELLRERFKAVFVDEFQDTDKLQYEIFNTVFNTNTNILFYIGDPKQSIYGWRMADINTYFEARTAVNNVYTMNTNFRSTKRLIGGLNELFDESSFVANDKGTGVFCNEENGTEEKRIQYNEVEAFENTKPTTCCLNNKEETPITIFNEYTDADAIRADLICLIQNLLTNGVLGDSSQQTNKIKPSDIAVLVRSGYKGKNIKEALDKLGIPSVLIDEVKIFNIPEAKDVLYILQAIQEGSSSAIHKALLSKLTGYSSTDIEKLNITYHIKRFKNYLGVLQSKGVYTCLLSFYEDYHTRNVLIGSADSITKNGLKAYSNVLQLAEALQGIQKQRGYELTGLIAFLKKAIAGEEVDGDEYVQRMESDESAIQISTIHKSKGLQYNIVLAPDLDLGISAKGAFSSFRNTEGAYYFEPNYNKPNENNKDFIIQTEQENRRLIYVALTRAKYQLYVFTQNKEALGALLQGKQDSKHIVIKSYPTEEVEFKPEKEETKALVYSEPSNFKLKDKDWVKMSFSFLSLPHATIPKTFTTENEGYDNFIFKELERGAHIGNLLHTIFEYIDFTTPEKWEKTIDINLKYYIPRKQEQYKPWMTEFLNHVLGANIQIPGNKPFVLKDIPNANKINELEFDINISDLHLSRLYDLQTDTVQFSFKNVDLYGILNGKIDLFFEHENKYYILDWKSNYLGDSLEEYTPEKLNDAMNESNYHLQYYIYTMAAKRYLESKIHGFDYATQFGGVIYLFLRGMRLDGGTGVFTTKLPLETVEAMEQVFCLDVAAKIEK